MYQAQKKTHKRGTQLESPQLCTDRMRIHCHQQKLQTLNEILTET
jgi:hypothetical protein